MLTWQCSKIYFDIDFPISHIATLPSKIFPCAILKELHVIQVEEKCGLQIIFWMRLLLFSSISLYRRIFQGMILWWYLVWRIWWVSNWMCSVQKTINRCSHLRASYSRRFHHIQQELLPADSIFPIWNPPCIWIMVPAVCGFMTLQTILSKMTTLLYNSFIYTTIENIYV